MSNLSLNQDSLYSLFARIIRFHYYRLHLLLEKEGLYPGQPPLLLALKKHNGLNQKELAAQLHIKASTITIMLNRLTKAKLIERRPDEKDLRISRVYLTDKGFEVIARIETALKKLENECFKGFSTNDQNLLREFFLKIRDNLSQVCGKDG